MADSEPSASEMNLNLMKSEALKKIVEHNRDYLKVDLTLPLGDPVLKKVHTNQWLFTDLPKEFDLANWTILAEALNANTNRYEGYVENRWYIESVDISCDATSGKYEMKLGLNAFASSYSEYSDAYKSYEKAYTQATSSSTKTTSASKNTSNAVTDKTSLINEEWVKKYDIPSIIVNKIKEVCELGNSDEDNVKAWHRWMDAHVDWQDYNDSQKSMESVINDGRGNCCDNSRVFRAGCLALGVKCTYMQGKSCCSSDGCASGHQWNKVYLGDKTVIVDNGRMDASWGSHWGSCGSEWETENSW